MIDIPWSSGPRARGHNDVTEEKQNNQVQDGNDVVEEKQNAG